MVLYNMVYNTSYMVFNNVLSDIYYGIIRYVMMWYIVLYKILKGNIYNVIW